MESRPGTSDGKAVREVFGGEYKRKWFFPEIMDRWDDVGGHIGSFAVWAALQGAFVTTYEPISQHVELLKRNLTRNGVEGSVSLIQAGIGATETYAPISINSKNGNTWRSSLDKVWAGGETEQVKVLPATVLQGNCLKIDAEGAEWRIIMCLYENNMLATKKKITFEWSFDIHQETAPFLEVWDILGKTHHLKGVTPRMIENLKERELWPKSWFPAKLNVFATRK